MSRAYELPIKVITGTKAAATDLSESRYAFVKLDTNGNIVVAGAGEPTIGVVQQPGEKDKGPMELPVMIAGVTFIKFGDTVATGDEVSVGAGGTAVKATAGVAGTSFPSTVAGIAMAGGAKDEIGCILLK